MIDPLCKRLMQELGITTFVETGTDQAETLAEVSRWCSEWDAAFGRIVDEVETGAKSYNAWNDAIRYPVFDEVGESKFSVHTVDTDSHTVETAEKLFASNANVHVHQQSSEKFLAEFVSELLNGDSEAADSCFFFLDAHWGKYWPLRDELREISRLNRFVAVIDDFFVPGKSDPAQPRGDFGFDYYGNDVLSWAYLRDVLKDSDVRVFYGVNENRDKRGWAVIACGYSDEQLNAALGEDFFDVAPDDTIHTQIVRVPVSARFSVKSVAKAVLPLPLLRALVRWRQGVTPVK